MSVVLLVVSEGVLLTLKGLDFCVSHAIMLSGAPGKRLFQRKLHQPAASCSIKGQFDI